MAENDANFDKVGKVYSKNYNFRKAYIVGNANDSAVEQQSPDKEIRK